MATHAVLLGQPDLTNVISWVWQFLLFDPQATFDPENSTSTTLLFHHGDGSDTRIVGTGLTMAGSAVRWTSISTIQHLNSSGGMIEQITGISLAPSLPGGGAFLRDLLPLVLSGNDTVTGSAGSDYIIAADGQDLITGGGGADYLRGGEGNDTFILGAGDFISTESIDGNIGNSLPHTDINSIFLNDAGQVDFRLGTIAYIQILKFNTGTSTAILPASYFDTSVTFPKSNISEVQGSAGADELVIYEGGNGAVNFTNITFTNWTSGQDKITFRNNLLPGFTATNQDDLIINPRGTVFGAAGNDTFALQAGHTGAGASYDGGADFDMLQIDGGGTVDLSGVTLTSVENLTLANENGTRVILSTAQIAAFTSLEASSSTDDTFAITDFSFLGTFGTPATRAAAFALLQRLHDNEVENVEWQEGGATNIAIVDGETVVVTSTDNGANTWDRSVYTFDPAGNRLSKVTTMDDGSVTTRTFGSDSTTDILLSDETTGIVGPVSSIVVNYNTAGRIVSRTVTYDDGRSTHTDFDQNNRVDTRTETTANGFSITTAFNDSNQRTSVTSDDTASNLYSWKTSTLTLSPVNGQVTQKFTELDNGNTVTEDYTNGLLTTRVTNDGGANEAFRSVMQNFAAGVFQWQSIVYDNNTGLIQGSASANTISQNNSVSDAIIGGGGADVFDFTYGMGTDRVLDFQDGLDLLDFTARGIGSLEDFSAFGASLSQAGGDVVINFGDGDVLTLKNFQLASLSNADFNALH